MTSGLVRDEELPVNDCEDGLTAWLKNPSIGPKGKFEFLTQSDILSYIILERAGMTPRQLFAEKVLPPLGIQDSEIDWRRNPQFTWQCDPDRRPEPVFGWLQLTISQMTKLGMLFFGSRFRWPRQSCCLA